MGVVAGNTVFNQEQSVPSLLRLVRNKSRIPEKRVMDNFFSMFS